MFIMIAVNYESNALLITLVAELPNPSVLEPLGP
jgi:hypothetical protein